MRVISLVFLFILSWSCSKPAEKKVTPKTGVEIIAIGSVNYGGVLLGNSKDAALKIINYDASSVDLNLDLPAPFAVISKSVSCSNNKIPPQGECIISIRFSPTDEGAFDLNLSLGNASIPLRGVGLLDGYVVIDVQDWSLGTVTAGDLRTKDITFTNLGDLTVQAPQFILPAYLKLGFNRCGNFIAARASCQIRFESRLETAQDYNVNISGTSEDAGTVEFSFSAQVEPAEPSGLITFSSSPESMSSAGAESTLVTNPIKDSYDNIVKSGTNVSVSVNNLLILLDGTSYQTDSNGKISFRVRTRTIKGSGTVSLLSSQSSGFVNFPITAGNAFGTITIPTSLNEIPANGQTQVVLSSQLIYDQYNNIIEDGTEVIFELTGDGQINSGANSKRKVTYAINGVASVTVKSGITAQVANLKVYSGPIYDQQNNIVGYSANGSVNLNFVPGPAEGIIPVFASVPAIYSNTNPPSDIVTLATKSRITIGPVKDKFQNVVKTNTQVSVVIENGFNSSGALPAKTSTLYTDTNGYASFDLIGESKRGNITIAASSALGLGNTSVWGYLKTLNQYITNTPTVSLFYKHAAASIQPLATSTWAPISKAEAIASLDNFYYGLQKESSSPKVSTVKLPYFSWQCFYPALDNLVGNFCMQSNGEFSPLLIYDSNHSVRFDVPSVNPQPELNENTTFAPDKQLQFWDYERANTDSAPQWQSLNASDGILLIDNRVALTQEQIDDDYRKRQAYSGWIDVDWTKKYVITYSAREQLGISDARAIEMGVVESESIDPAIINDPDFDLVPLLKLLQEDVYLSTAMSSESFRVVYSPPQGVRKIRLYFSTKGRGNQARIMYDNISFKRIDTQNIHDPLVTEGPSVAYMPLLDQSIMFGGSTLEELPGPSYSPAVSNRNTLLTKVLDKSSSVVVENFVPGGQEFDLGAIPSARAHAPMVSVGQDKAYLFGGFDSSSVSAFNDLFSYNSSLRRWSEVAVQPDLSLPGAVQNEALGKPTPRYQHGFSYVPELNRLYVIGGVRQDPEVESIWYNNDDVWYIDLALTPLRWKRVCDMCGGLGSAVYVNLADAIVRLQNIPNATNLSNYVLAQRTITRMNLVWHSASQKFYIHLPETNFLKTFDPITEAYDNPEPKGMINLVDGFQLVYNQEIGRTFAYKRGTIGQENSTIKYWDMNNDEKQYLKVRFNLGASAKNYMQEFAVKLYAYGQSKTTRLSGDTFVRGVNTFLYNYTTSSWDVLANHSISSGVSVPQIFKKINDNSVKNYISTQGVVEFLITPKGRPGIDGGEELMGNDLDYVNLGMDFQDNLLTVQQVVTSNRATCVLLTNGRVKCWGSNESGVLGHNLQYAAYGTEEGHLGNNLPTTQLFDPNLPANAGLSISKIFMGKNHACALFNNGKAKCWGENGFSQLGYSDFTDRGREVIVGESLAFLNTGTLDETNNTTNSQIIDMTLGDDHTCAIIRAYSLPNLPSGQREQTLQNRIKCWGRFNYGQVGIANASTALTSVNATASEKALQLKGNDTKFLTLPTEFDPILEVSKPKAVVKLSSGNNHVCASLSDKTIVCWGDNRYGQLGLNNMTQASVPTGMQFPNSNVVDINISLLELGGNHSCLVFNENASLPVTKCWGQNEAGQLGQGNIVNVGDAVGEMQSLAPISLPAGLYPIKINLGQKNTCAVLNNNRLVCWGDNTEGQLGYGFAAAQVGTTPQSMGNNLNFVDLGTSSGTQPIQVSNVVSYGNYNCVVTTTNLLKCFGENGFGQLGYEDELNRGKGEEPGDGLNEVKLDYIQLETVF